MKIVKIKAYWLFKRVKNKFNTQNYVRLVE